MYIYADWFPAAVLAAEAAAVASGGTAAAGRKGMAGQGGGRAVVLSPVVKTSQQAVANTTRTLTWLLEILHEEFREVYTVIQERLRLERERLYAVPA